MGEMNYYVGRWIEETKNGERNAERGKEKSFSILLDMINVVGLVWLKILHNQWE